MAAAYRREIFNWPANMTKEERRETEIFWATFATAPASTELLYTRNRIRLSPSRLAIIEEEIRIDKINRANAKKAEEEEIAKLNINDLLKMIDENVIPNCLSPIKDAPKPKCLDTMSELCVPCLDKRRSDTKFTGYNNLKTSEYKYSINDHSKAVQQKSLINNNSKATEQTLWKTDNSKRKSLNNNNSGTAKSKNAKKSKETIFIEREMENELQQMLNDDFLFSTPKRISRLPPTPKRFRKSGKSKRVEKYKPVFNTVPLGRKTM